MPPPPPELPDDLVGDILLRLPPDDPACLLRASLVCRRWRRLLADPAFRRRHRALHRRPSFLGFLGFLRVVRDDIPYCSRFVPNNPASRRPAARDLPGWLVLDCRHGRALFATPSPSLGDEVALDFLVWDPLTGEQRRLPRPSPPPTADLLFNAAVLCAAHTGGCDHRGCHGGAFLVAFLFTKLIGDTGYITSARVYSSETGDWSDLTIVQHPDVYVDTKPLPSVLVGDALYFCGNLTYAFEYQFGVGRLLLIGRPPPSVYQGRHIFLISMEDGGLGCTDVEEEPNLCLRLWSREAAPNGVASWIQGRAIDLNTLLPATPCPWSASFPRPDWMSSVEVLGFVDGTDIMFVGKRTFSGGIAGVYMVKLNSGRATKVFEGRSCVFPYMSFSIPVKDAIATTEGSSEGLPRA
ncbi:hypothetical protein ACP70R_048367 [Stipagrostis hirtigluma subsp. patula]